MKTTLVVGLAITAQAAANTLLAKGMKVIASTPSFSEGFSPLMLVHAMQSPFIWAGIFLLVVYFAGFLSALSWADLSRVLPVTAIGYILDVLTGHYLLGEPVSLVRWTGSVIIVLGVALVSVSEARDSEPEDEDRAKQGTAC
ncbi:MAG: EamA family transporter [Phycisphaerales bacterium]|jgi:drug/metabolite transporter (DMT)-like permease